MSGAQDQIPQLQPQAISSMQSPAANSFFFALEREPLSNACITVLTKVHKPGSGLKILRLVSRRVSAAMTQAIHNYNLIIDGVEEELPAVRLLKHTQLTSLEVEVLAGEKSGG